LADKNGKNRPFTQKILNNFFKKYHKKILEIKIIKKFLSKVRFFGRCGFLETWMFFFRKLASFGRVRLFI